MTESHNGDLISRAQVKEAMIHYGFHAPDMTVTEFVEDVLTTIEAEVVRHGRWVPNEQMTRSPFVRNWHCSECKTLGSPQWKGCPVCLARMDGE